MKQVKRLLPLIFVIGLFLALFFRTAEAKNAVIDGLLLCGKVLIPSLFPFYVASNLFLFLGYGQALGRRTGKLLPRLFGVPSDGAGAWILGLIGGYPIGAQTAAELYRQKLVTKKDAERLTAFCNNAGPAFVIGAAGLVVFQSPVVGLVLYMIHGLSAAVTGWLLSGGGTPGLLSKRLLSPQKPMTFSAALPAAVVRAVKSLLNICGFVLFFYMLLQLAGSLPGVQKLSYRLQELSSTFPGLLSGCLEISCGILALQGCPAAEGFVAAAALLGWGGFCVHFQTLSVLIDAGLSGQRYLKGKALQALISTLLAIPAAALLYGSVSPLPMLLAPLILIFLFLFCKKRGSNLRRSLL